MAKYKENPTSFKPNDPRLIGNKFSVGNKGGVPRSITPEKEELIKLGQELVTWATEETDELRCRFSQWYCLKKGFIKSQWDLMRVKPEFTPYYESARVALGQKYIDGTINSSIAHRFLRIYCPEVKQEEDMTADEDAKRKILIADSMNQQNKTPPTEELNHIRQANMFLHAELDEANKKISELTSKLNANQPQTE